ncbi:MAG: hypothetical protein LBH87_01130 [Coriobacteriales bacterium]|jgi:hypothetical protein|nr:hypothetical protein [Coriobacteriales bacterium]
MFCQNCGANMPENISNCPTCGASVVPPGGNMADPSNSFAQPTVQPGAQQAGMSVTQQPQYNPYQQQYAQPQQYPPQSSVFVYQAPVVARPSNGLAVAGFVLSLLFIQPLGLIFSIIGLVTSGSKEGVGRGLAIAGVVISCIGLIGLIILIVSLGVFSASYSTYSYY